jgi:enamine deaminase RidA (YjgF/YER057c/UK114 family)
MQRKIIRALGRRFVHLRVEGDAASTPAAALREIVQQCRRELGTFGLTLDDTVRTRLWARTADARTRASAERRSLFDGPARASSSSYIATSYFDSPADVALELLALEPARRAGAKVVVEYDPPAAPPMYVVYDGMVFLSGVNHVEPALEDAVPKTLAQLGDGLVRAGTSWDRVVSVASYVARAHALEAMERVLQATVRVPAAAQTAYVSVDGYAGPGVHAEIEVTATLR